MLPPLVTVVNWISVAVEVFSTLLNVTFHGKLLGRFDSSNLVIQVVSSENVTDTVDPASAVPDEEEGVSAVVQSNVAEELGEIEFIV